MDQAELTGLQADATARIAAADSADALEALRIFIPFIIIINIIKPFNFIA